MLKQRVKKLEGHMRPNPQAKVWDVKCGSQGEKRAAEIIAGRAKHPDGSHFSENDINIFIDFDKFMPKTRSGEDQSVEAQD